MSLPSVVASLDIGSNSIKILVAEMGVDQKIIPLFERTDETRISDGISVESPVLTEANMQAGLDAILGLLADAKRFGVEAILLTATSAVRDAENREEFLNKVYEASDQRIRVLSGDEEAEFIACGILQDSKLELDKPFCLADLGGGSMELVHFSNAEMKGRVSLQLGAVRLLEKFISEPEKEVPVEEAKAICGYVKNELKKVCFDLDSSAFLFVGTGGAVTFTRLLCAAKQGKSLLESSAVLSLDQLRELYSELASQTLLERSSLPVLPKKRADIMPVALLVLISVMEVLEVTELNHSLCSLRFGVCFKLLSKGFA